MNKKTYLMDCLDKGRLVRWADSIMPLKFYIAPFRWYKEAGSEYKYKQMVLNALNTWERASGNRLKFNVVNTLLESQINLDWKRVDRRSLGYCTYNIDKSGQLYSAEIQIGLSDGIIHSQYMDENEVYHTILHEIGHGIGLLDHSPNITDMMYTPHQYGVINLSACDTNTIQWLYKLPFGKTPQEIAQMFNMPATTDLDALILQLEHKVGSSAFQKEMQSIKNPQKDLLDETTRLAEIKKYQMMLQNIKLPDSF